MGNLASIWLLAGTLCLLAPAASPQDSALPPAATAAPAAKLAPPAVQAQPAGSAQPATPPPAATVEEQIQVEPPPEAEPPSEGPPPPPMRPNDPRMMAAGIGITCIGAAGALVGVSLIVSSPEEVVDPHTPAEVDEEMRNGGIALAISGVVFMAVGIPLIAVGARRVPLRGSPEARFIGTPGGGALMLSF